MNGIWYYAIAFIVIWAIAFVLKDQLEKVGVEVSFPVLMWRTTKLRGLVDRIANRAPRFWKWFMNAGIVISAFFMVFMAVLLLQSLTTITEVSSVSLVLPGVEVPGSPFFIPFFSGFIALITVIIVHEFSHGILARVEKVDIKSMGLLLFAILPGAFVEPDEDEVKELDRPARMRIYVAGSMANLSLAVVALIIMTLISSSVIPAVFHEDGVEITRLTDDGNAHDYLKTGMILKSINNYTIGDADDYSSAVRSLTPNKTVSILTDQGSYSFKLKSNPANHSLGYMGIQAKAHYLINDNYSNKFYSPYLWVLLDLPELFMWIFMLNFSIGTFNLLPMKPLDGGALFEDLMSYVASDDTVKIASQFMTYLMAITIIVSLVYSFTGGLV